MGGRKDQGLLGPASAAAGGTDNPFHPGRASEPRAGSLPGPGLLSAAALERAPEYLGQQSGAQALAGGHPLIGAGRLGLGTFGGAWNPTTALREGGPVEASGGALGLGRAPWSGAGHLTSGAGGAVAGRLGGSGRGLGSALHTHGGLLAHGASAGGADELSNAASDAVARPGRALANGTAAAGPAPHLSNLASTAGGTIARGWHKLFG